MKKFIVIVGLLLGTTACTPQEIAFWAAWRQSETQPAEPAVASSPAVRLPVSCYTTPGGTLCAEDGTPEAALYAELQRLLFEGVGVAEPEPSVGTLPPDPEPQPANVRCFILVGGTFCYEEGTADYDRAAVLEAEYLSTDHNLAPREAAGS